MSCQSYLEISRNKAPRSPLPWSWLISASKNLTTYHPLLLRLVWSTIYRLALALGSSSWSIHRSSYQTSSISQSLTPLIVRSNDSPPRWHLLRMVHYQRSLGSDFISRLLWPIGPPPPPPPQPRTHQASHWWESVRVISLSSIYVLEKKWWMGWSEINKRWSSHHEASPHDLEIYIDIYKYS